MTQDSQKTFLSRGILAAIVALTAPWMAGCVHFHDQPLSANRTAERFEARTLADPGLKRFMESCLANEFKAPPAFGFTNLVLAALYFHPDMDVARAKWAGSRAATKTSAERPNPTLSVSPAYDTTTSIPSPWLATASLDFPLETAGKRGYRIAQAKQLSDAARLNLASAAWIVRSRVRQRMADFYFAREGETLLKEQQSLQTQSLHIVEAQFEAGAISSFELTQARIGAENIRFLLRDAERQSAEARVQLADAVGVPVKAIDGVEISFEGLGTLPREFSPREARREALQSRVDIRAALKEYAASQSALQLEIAKQYPDVHLSPGYEFDQGDNKWSLGIGITLPILNRNQGAISEALAKRDEAAANFVALQAHALAEIDRATVAYQAARQKAADAESLRENLLKQEKSLKGMLDAGEISKADVIGLELQLSASALTRLDAIAKAQQALGALEDALQQPAGLSPSMWETAPRRRSESEAIVAHP